MKTKYEEFIEDAGRRRLYEAETLAFEATELIASLMKAQRVSKSELAGRIGKTKSHVTQVLSGSRNMTLKTFADLVYALGHKVELRAAPYKKQHCCPAKSRTESTACHRRLNRPGSPMPGVPVEWAFFEKGDAENL